MPSALLARRLRSRLWCQKQVGIGHRGRSVKNKSMTRHLPFLIGLLLLTHSNLFADTDRKPTQVEIVSVLGGFDISAAVGKQLIATNGDQTVQLPKVTTKGGKTAVIRVVREFPHPIDFDAENTPIAFDISNLGVTLTIKPYIVNGEIKFSGNLLLATASVKEDSKPKNYEIPTIRTSKKIFSGKAKSGEPIVFTALSPSGEEITLSLTLMLMDQEGMRVE